MQPGYGLQTWSSTDWHEQAVSWLDEKLGAAGVERTGAVRQPHLRPWGTVLTAPTTRGAVWLKAPGPQTTFEVGLYQLFLTAAPEWVLSPVALDTDRGWLVLPDGGDVLGDSHSGADLVDALTDVLPKYGALQRDLMPRVDELLAIGVADMRAAAMPARFDEALAVVGRYLAQYGDPVGREIHRKVAAGREAFVAGCVRLAAAAVPASLDHNDLHPWNIFVSGVTDQGHAKFYDWGDSVVAHPFASMLVALGFLRGHLGVAPDDPAILRVRDAYLEVFGDLAPHRELVGELELACRTAKIARVLTWDRSLQAQGYGEAGEFGKAPFRCLAALLSASHLDLGA